MSDAQKRADIAQVKRWESAGIRKVTLRIGELDREKFFKLAEKSRNRAYKNAESE